LIGTIPQNITQYFATVPAADLDVALKAQAACLRGIDDSQQQWAQEPAAIDILVRESTFSCRGALQADATSNLRQCNRC